jgi:hypothetical protein
MQRNHCIPAFMLAALLGLAACSVERVVDAPPPVYSQTSPYAPATPAYQPTDSYCAEAVGEAQDAAAQASVTGRGRDVGRAERTAGYARRDCR